jgi:hypothetical protein
MHQLEAGVDLLRQGRPDGFVVRAVRKLGRAYLLVGSPRQSLKTLDEGYRLATELGLFDQISSLDRIAGAIGHRRGKSVVRNIRPTL